MATQTWHETLKAEWAATYGADSFGRCADAVDLDDYRHLSPAEAVEAIRLDAAAVREVAP